MTNSPQELLSFEDLEETGMLWLINRVCFHPRGFAFSLHRDGDGAIGGWSLQGDGSECWSFSELTDDAKFVQINNFLASCRTSKENDGD